MTHRSRNKVLHIITGLGDGGAEGVLARLCLHAKEASHVVISLMDEGKYGAVLKEANVCVYSLGLNPSKPNPVKLLSLIKLIRKESPDVVQTWMYHADLLGGVAAKLAGVKAVFWGVRHSVLEKGKSKRSTIIISKLCAWLSPFIPEKIICCADKSLQVHADIGYQKSKLIVIQNGYDLSRFEPNTEMRIAIRDQYGISSEVILLGMVGRYDPLKDHKNLLRSLSFLKNKSNIKCLLVGKGLSKENAELAQIISAYDLKDIVILAGQQTNIPAIMNSLDVHVLSSSSEGFPNVLTEAMACGTPCVSTDVGDAAIIVKDTGWVIPAHNSQLLSGAISIAIDEKINHPAKWQERQRQCRSRVEESFNIEMMVSGYMTAWDV